MLLKRALFYRRKAEQLCHVLDKPFAFFPVFPHDLFLDSLQIETAFLELLIKFPDCPARCFTCLCKQLKGKRMAACTHNNFLKGFRILHFPVVIMLEQPGAVLGR